MQLKMRPLLILSLLFCASCGDNNPQQTSDILLHDTSILFTNFNSKPKQFECGTSELLQTQLRESGIINPDNFKAVSFITSKYNFYIFLNRAKKDSLTISSFNLNRFKEFYIPTAKDSIWLTLPFNEVCQIRKGKGDSLPINISYSVDTHKRLNVTLATDSTITNQLTKIIKDYRLGNLIVQN